MDAQKTLWRCSACQAARMIHCAYPEECGGMNRYILAAEHDRLMAEARNMALEEAALYIEQRDGSIPCRQEIASAIRAMKG